MSKLMTRAHRRLGRYIRHVVIVNLVLLLSVWVFYHQVAPLSLAPPPDLYVTDQTTPAVHTVLPTVHRNGSSASDSASQTSSPPLEASGPSSHRQDVSGLLRGPQLEFHRALKSGTVPPGAGSHLAESRVLATAPLETRPPASSLVQPLAGHSERLLFARSGTSLSSDARKRIAAHEEEERRDSEYLLVPLPIFRPKLLRRERSVVRHLLARLAEELRQGEITFLLYSGSLLGSLRHHGLVPWDDDVDVLVDRRHQQALFRRLSQLKPAFFLDVRNKVRWKFYSALSRPIKAATWCWPFIDISFFDHNATHLWDSDPRFSSSYAYPLDMVFPLTERPFMDFLLPAPRRSEAVVRRNYRPEVCAPNIYDHRLETALQKIKLTVYCRALRSYFPFVRQVSTEGGVNETLVYKHQVLGWFFTPA